ncbi:MAG TPA: dihydrodipicolinate synthase family protein [Candidatus Limnocylindrales bacterium]
MTDELARRTGQLQGVWNIVPTPFHDDEEIDHESLDTLTDFVVAAGVDGMTILGVLGEGAKVTDSERSAITNAVIKRADGRVPVCVTVSAPSGHNAVVFAREARAVGAHSVMLSAPPLTRPNDDAVRRHYFRVAEAVPELPVVIQDLPTLGVWMSADLIARMAAEAPNLTVVKVEEEPSAPKVGRLLAANPDLRVLGGLGGEMLVEELRRGAVGTMTGFGYPEVLVAIMRDWRAGSEDAAVERFHRWMPLIRFENQQLLNLPIRKRIYMKRGAIRSDKLRAPGPLLDEQTIRDLDDVLARIEDPIVRS